jgi:hypothetical protein
VLENRLEPFRRQRVLPSCELGDVRLAAEDLEDVSVERAVAESTKVLAELTSGRHRELWVVEDGVVDLVRPRFDVSEDGVRRLDEVDLKRRKIARGKQAEQEGRKGKVIKDEPEIRRGRQSHRNPKG